MDKYRLIQEHLADDTSETPQAARSQRPAASTEVSSRSGFPEMRITQQGKPRNYITYAMNHFSDGEKTIVLKAMGRAMNKAVTIAEILKRKMPLHQWNALSSMEMIDVYEPVEEGLDVVESRRYVSCMTITLSKELLVEEGDETMQEAAGERYDTNHAGYQPPLPASEMHPRDLHSEQQQVHRLVS